MTKRKFIKEIQYQDTIGLKLMAKHKAVNTWTDFRVIGTVVDETEHMLVVRDDPKQKTYTQYVKNQYIFRCWQPEAGNKLDSTDTQILIEFDGNTIDGVPAKRIKKIKKQRSKLH